MQCDKQVIISLFIDVAFASLHKRALVYFLLLIPQKIELDNKIMRLQKVKHCGLLLIMSHTLIACQTIDIHQEAKLNATNQPNSECLQRCMDIVAQRAITEMGQGFNLGQMFESEQHHPTFATAKPKINAYYRRGYRTVRIPVTWTEKMHNAFLANPDTGVVNRKSPKLEEITAVIDYALSKPGMYIILNAHHEKNLKDSSKSHVLAQLWRDISTIFQDRDHRLIFQLLNEPHLNNRGPMPPEDLRYMSELAYNNIRAIDEQRLIVIGGNHWFAAEEMKEVWPTLEQVGGGKDMYLMATFHHYSPWEFSGDNQGDYADKWTEDNIREPMETMTEWSRTIGKGMPFFIGEWGVGWGSRYATMRCNNIRLWYTKFANDFATPKGIPTIVWDDGGWFKVFDHQINEFANNLIDCMDGSCAWDGTERFNEQCK